MKVFNIENKFNPSIEKIEGTFDNIYYHRKKRLNVLAYNENLQAFTSFYSTNPNWVIDMFDNLYSIDSRNRVRIHNRKKQDDKSMIRFVVNKSAAVTKSFDNVEYTAYFDNPDSNFSRVYFETNRIESDDVKFIGHREDNYRFAIPRAKTLSGELYPNRMKGKYLISNYEFDNPGEYFKIPFITTKFRQTHI